jgi:hypothetical protein
MSSSNSLPGEKTAQELIAAAEEHALSHPFEEILTEGAKGKITEDHSFRLAGRLWAIKRLMYYTYGNWAQGINLNEYPASIHYLLAKQQYDESNQEMNYADEILARSWVRTQSRMFKHEYCEHVTASRISRLIFTYRAMANYAHNIRIAALNLGPKIIELKWLEQFSKKYPDESLRRIFQSQIAETASHVQMGRFIAERFLVTEVDSKLVKTETAVVCTDYVSAMQEITDFVLEGTSE